MTRRKPKAEERCKFEKWLATEQEEPDLTRSVKRPERYKSRETQLMWSSWNARSKARPPKDLLLALQEMVGAFYASILLMPESKAKLHLAKHFLNKPAEANAVLNKYRPKSVKLKTRK